MTPLQRKIIAKTTEIIERSPQRIYSKRDLVSLYQQTSYELTHEWKYQQDRSSDKFINLLLEQGLFKVVALNSPYQNAPVRYAHGSVSLYELALSIKKNAYLSHGSAAFLHGLTAQEPSTIYVNKEQTSKTRLEGHLTQQALSLAFSREQRRSKFVLRYGKARITLLSGKSTNRLGVKQIQDGRGALLDLTGLERTLIDITVRPGYAGGVPHVLQCFMAARNKIELTELTRILRTLDYVYPYHQALGFYLKTSGYEREFLSDLRTQGLQYDFYLVHGVAKLKYDSEWRIFYPAELKVSF